MRCYSLLYHTLHPRSLPTSPTSSFALSWQCAGDTEVSNDNNNDRGININARFADWPRDSPPLLHIFAMSPSKSPIRTIDGRIEALIGGRGAGAKS